MKVYRVSSVERFRQWEADPDADDVAGLIADIKGDTPPSQAMRAGTALHAILEKAEEGVELEEAEHDGFHFFFGPGLEVELTPVREVRASKTYTVDGEPIVISGQCDQIDGQRIDDHKSTGRFDPERYLEGFQWRLYLDIFGGQRFRWNVFEIRELGEGTCDYEVAAQHRLEQCRYPGMEADCRALVQRFARFVRAYIETEASEGAAT